MNASRQSGKSTTSALVALHQAIAGKRFAFSPKKIEDDLALSQDERRQLVKALRETLNAHGQAYVLDNDLAHRLRRGEPVSFVLRLEQRAVVAEESPELLPGRRLQVLS